MNDYPMRIQIGVAAILGLILLNLLLPISLGWKIIGSLIIILCVTLLILRIRRYRKMITQSTNDITFLAQKLDLLPARQRYRLPILMVSGSAAKEFFPQDLSIAESHVVVSSQAVWVYVQEYAQLPIVFDSLIARWPDMVGRIGIFLAINPEIEDKHGLYIAKLQAFRQSWVDTCRLAKYRLPVYVSTHVGLNNLHYHDNATVPAYWYQVIDGRIYLLDEYLSPLENWANAKNIGSVERQQRLHLQAMLREVAIWHQRNVLDILANDRQPIAKCIPTASAIFPLNTQAIKDNVISTLFSEITTLPLANDNVIQTTIVPPDRLVKFMPIAYPYSPTKKTICNLVIMLSVFLMASLGASYWNNIKLFEQVKNDISHYDLIAMDSYDEKLAALNIIKTDRTLINDYFAQGEPIRLGFGLYHGQTLLEPLNLAISRYVPPPPPPEPPPEPEKIIIKEKEIVIKEPAVIRLDSLALFESGQATLKNNSNKVLVNALMDIKTQIQENKENGWLILIAGHTDSTGDANKNQQLSLERAAAVRDWIIDISDIPETCFAIQGYGAKKPLVSNDTPDERAQNRRVEISLVPQISNCMSMFGN